MSGLAIVIGLNPTLISIGPVVVTWHGLFTALAVGVALAVAGRAIQRAGFDKEKVWSVITWAMAGGLIGARAFYYLDHPELLRAGPAEVLAVWQGGIAVYGSFLGGIVGGYARARLLRLAPWPLLDLAVVPMLVGQAIGRVGCLINGDAWGGPTGLPWAVIYRHPDALLPASLHGLPTHPYPLYELGWDALVVSALLIAGPRLRRPGDRFLLGAVGYGVGRFWLSFVRQERALAFGLQEAQLVALLTSGLALTLFLLGRAHPQLKRLHPHRWPRRPAVTATSTGGKPS
jgi:phosphatidylglycerol:prolipoprotein diacylglycerol transferase